MSERQTYPIDTIAKLLDLTPRRVNQLVDEGVFPKAGRGTFELVPVVKGYIKHLRDRIAAGNESDGYTEHRARLTKARADMAELERAQIIASLVPADDIEAAWSAVTAAMRSRLLAIPSKVAPRLMAMKTVNEAQELIRAEIFGALEELANVRVEVSTPLRSSDPGADRDLDARGAHASAASDD